MWQNKSKVHFSYLFKLEHESVGKDNINLERIGNWFEWFIYFHNPNLVFLLWLSILQMYVGNGKFYYQLLAFDINLFDLYEVCSLHNMFTYMWHGHTRPVHLYRLCRICMKPVYTFCCMLYMGTRLWQETSCSWLANILYIFVGLLPFLFSVF